MSLFMNLFVPNKKEKIQINKTFVWHLISRPWSLAIRKNMSFFEYNDISLLEEKQIRISVKYLRSKNYINNNNAVYETELE